MKIAIVHDSLSGVGGQRVLRAMVGAFPDAAVHAAPAALRGRTHDGMPQDPPGAHHLALPLLAPAFSAMHVDADIILVSSNGWAHGVRTSGRSVVYCHSPARWNAQEARHLAGHRRWKRMALRAGARQGGWDQADARMADRYLVASRAGRQQVGRVFGIDAEVLHPPVDADGDGARVALPWIAPGYVLCVEPLRSHRNVEAIIEAMRWLPDARLVIAGTGPLQSQLEVAAGANVTLVGDVDPWHLRWLYANAAVAVGASSDDVATGPVMAAAHGVPFVAPCRGGYLDTVRHGTTGLFFDAVDGPSVAAALITALRCQWDAGVITAHAGRFGEQRFVSALREVVDEEWDTVRRMRAAGREADRRRAAAGRAAGARPFDQRIPADAA